VFKAARFLGAAAVAVIATVGAGAPANAAVTPGQYVALGDSWAAGVGASPDDPAPDDCRRNPNSYPQLWVRNHPGFQLDDQTCSGATVASVRSGQMGTLSAETKLVTITVGGNDDGFESTLTACFTGTDQECQDATTHGAEVARQGLADDLALLYNQVEEKAPNARVMVLGYSRLIDAGDGSCGLLTPDATRRSWLRNNADQLAEGIRDATQRAGVSFVDMRLGFDGHEACSADPFIIGADGSNAMFHPNQRGHSVFAFWLQLQTDLH
jgi:lysophospholipase L1-like esterase